MCSTTEVFVRLVYTKPASDLTPAEVAARERLQDVLNQLNESINRFHEETPGQDGLLAIELYPCDEATD